MSEHTYLSTACHHGDHDYCQSTTGQAGARKNPAQCKWCAAPCVCSCHGGNGLHAEPHLTDLVRELDKALGVLLQVGTYLSLHAESNAALHCSSDRVMYSPLHSRVSAAIHDAHQALNRAAPTTARHDE